MRKNLLWYQFVKRQDWFCSTYWHLLSDINYAISTKCQPSKTFANIFVKTCLFPPAANLIVHAFVRIEVDISQNTFYININYPVENILANVSHDMISVRFYQTRAWSLSMTLTGLVSNSLIHWCCWDLLWLWMLNTKLVKTLLLILVLTKPGDRLVTAES